MQVYLYQHSIKDVIAESLRSKDTVQVNFTNGNLVFIDQDGKIL
jgi:carbonic anhydrase